MKTATKLKIHRKPYRHLTPPATAWARINGRGRIELGTVTDADRSGMLGFVQVVILTEFDYHKLTERRG